MDIFFIRGLRLCISNFSSLTVIHSHFVALYFKLCVTQIDALWLSHYPKE